ncbi:MAG: CD225/dispanin family protein [Candidatus Magnetominusculus sp. LBB02]|nr:CD225/dispanin family protein [Candidatus Magnetominusculus sp. LBB02]
MIYCSKCGTQHEDNTYKCVKCEALLHTPAVESAPRIVQEHIPDYLVWSILTTLFCCLPVGIVAIVYSAQVGSKVKDGDIEGARGSSKKAKMWCWISLGSWVAIVLIGIIVALVGGALSQSH